MSVWPIEFQICIQGFALDFILAILFAQPWLISPILHLSWFGFELCSSLHYWDHVHHTFLQSECLVKDLPHCYCCKVWTETICQWNMLLTNVLDIKLILAQSQQHTL